MRYIILVLLNVPIIILAFINIITQYKMRKISSSRFKKQLFVWLAVLVALISSFPLYNYLAGLPLLDSSELSLFDIVQTTAIVVLFYAVNSQRQKIESNERHFRELHQELSIKLSAKK